MFAQAKYNLILQIVNFLGPLATIPIAVSVFGLEVWGEVAYGMMIASIFAFVSNYSMLTSGNKIISGCCESERSVILIELSSFQFYATILSLLSYTLYCIFDRMQVNIFAPLTFVIIANSIDYSWYYYSNQKYKELAVITGFVRATSAVISIGCVLLFDDVWPYLLSQSLTVICINLICAKKFNIKLIENIQFLGLKTYSKYVKKLSPVFFVQLLMFSYSLSDRLLIKNHLGYAELGLYDLLLKYLTAVTMVAVALRPILISIVSKNASNLEILRRNVTKSICVVLSVTSLIYLLTCLYLPASISIVLPRMTEINDNLQLIIILMCSVVVTSGVGDVFVNQVLLALGKNKQFFLIIVTMFLMIVLGNIYAIPAYGLLGASVVAAIAHIVILLPEWFLVKECFESRIISKTTVNLLLLSAAVVFVSALMKYFLPSSLLTMFFCAVISIFMFIFGVTRKTYYAKFM